MGRLRSSVRQLPRTDDRCPWWGDLPAPGPANRLRGDVEADCVIVGGGFTGLAAARELGGLRPDWTVVVVEALRVGQGPAGRNSGFIMDLGHIQPSLGVDGNRAIVDLSRAGLDALREAVNDATIACDWLDGHRLHVAVNDRGARCLAHFREGLDAMREPYEVLDGSAVQAVTGSAYYREALALPGGAMVQPAALVRGLASALPPNVRLYEETPVLGFEHATAHTLATPDGALTSPRLILATNGFTPWLGPQRGRLIPLLTFASVTRRLTESEQARLGGEPQWGLVPEERMGSTVRRTAEGRILVRNGVRFAADPRTDPPRLERFSALHRRSFEVRFPMLADVEFECTWSGVLGMSINNGTVCQDLGDGIFLAAGHNGVGMALGTAAGMAIAHRAAGQQSPLDPWFARLPTPIYAPPGPWLRWGIQGYTATLQALAGSER